MTIPRRGAEIETLALYVNGRSRPSSDQRYFDSVDPFTGSVWSRVPSATAEDVDEAVRAAHAAFMSGPWADTRRAGSSISLVTLLPTMLKNSANSRFATTAS